MNEKVPLEATERTWLCDRPPMDEHEQLVPWRLVDRRIRQERWDSAVEQVDLTIERVEFESLRWRGQTVFRRCVFRDVRFSEVLLMGLRFEDVLFERCSFDTLSMDDCVFVRCRFQGGALDHWRGRKVQWIDCAFEELRAHNWDLGGCVLSRCVFRDSSVIAFRASECRLDDCAFSGGDLQVCDWTLCNATALHIRGAKTRGFRVLEGKFDSVVVSDLRHANLSFMSLELGAFSLRGCSEQTTVRLGDARLGAVHVEGCPSLQSFFVHGSTLGDLTVRDSTLSDTTFEDVEASGEARFEGSGLSGLFFKGGAWAGVRLVDVVLADYLAVEDTRFASLELGQVREVEGLRYRLDGARYGAGSMTWRAPHGT